MKLNQLRALVCVHETGSLQEASAVLHLTQSAVSRTIKELESDVGLALVQRSNKGMTLTESGQRLLMYARQTLETVRRAKQEMDDLKGLAASEVTLGVTPVTALLGTVKQALVAFQRHHPRSALKIIELRPSVLLQHLRDGLLDVAVTSHLPAVTTGMDWQLQERLPGVVVVREGHDLATADSLRTLHNTLWVSVDPLADQESQFNRTFDNNALVRPANVIECTAMNLALKLLRETDAAMVMCGAALESDRDAWTGSPMNLRVLPVREALPDYPISLVCLDRHRLSRIAEHLYAFLEGAARVARA